MDRYRLPKSIEINGVECPIDSDYRNILDIFTIFNDPDLIEPEKIMVALDYFYCDDNYKTDLETAAKQMVLFINGGAEDTDNSHKNEKPLYDWDQDFSIIIAPVNKVLGQDARGMEYLHWWTFLSAFMEIGECTFNTFVGIRDKLNRGKKLDKSEEKIYKDNRDRINLKRKHDSTTQALMDEILGKGM